MCPNFWLWQYISHTYCTMYPYTGLINVFFFLHIFPYHHFITPKVTLKQTNFKDKFDFISHVIIHICNKLKSLYVSIYYSEGTWKHKIATWTHIVLCQTHISPECSVIFLAACVCRFLTVKERPEVLVVSFHQPLNGRRQNLSFFYFCVEHGAL